MIVVLVLLEMMICNYNKGEYTDVFPNINIELLWGMEII